MMPNKQESKHRLLAGAPGLIVLLLFNFTLTIPGQSAPPAGIEQFAQQYVQYANAGTAEGIDRLMNLFGKDPSIVSIQVGEILQGPEAIRAKAMAFLPQAQKIQFGLGKITAFPVGPETVLVVVALRITPKQAPAAAAPSRDAAISWVLRRSPDGWRILHEHFSLMPAPSS